jgi:hypothetical protein
MYSKNLEWGYFDHPPMIAFMIYIGDSLIHNELGVRLIVIFISTLTMAMIMNELNEKKDMYFLAVFMLSFPLVHTHIGGFLALPDTPLVFFTLLFYLCYKKFVDEPNLKIALLLAFVAAAMIYSKYHAFLVLGLVVLSNLKLLRNKYFWITVFVVVMLLIPHIWWQIENHFPTLKYHLISRTKPVRFWTVQNNITSQLLVAGPLSGIIVFYSLSKFKISGDAFKRAIIFSVLGFYIFFFIMSFKNRIEAHYTTAITPLLMIATYPVISNHIVLKKWFKRLAVPLILFFFFFRFYLSADFLPNYGGIKNSFYNHKSAAEEVKNMAADKTVASFNNFAFPGIHQFYTGDPVIHMAVPGYRYCQFDLWDEETLGEGKPLLVYIPDRMDTTNNITLANGRKARIIEIAEFQSLKHLELELSNITILNDSIKMQVTLINGFGYNVEFNHPSMPLIGFTQPKQNEISATPIYKITGKELLTPGGQVTFPYSVPLDQVDQKQPVLIFTQTVERNRGQLASVHISDYMLK